MATALAGPKHMAMSDLKGKVDPDWCPGCRDFGVLAAVQKALLELQIPNHNVVTISGNHFVHTMRRNVDLLYIVMDNQIYGLTTGQTSPTSRIGMKTKSMPFGNIEAPVNPISLALAAGATFIARGFSGEQKHLTELIKQGIEHKGFSFLDVFSPCVTYNLDNTYQWFRPRVKKLEDDSSYDPADWTAAMGKSLLWGEEIPIGKFFERTDVPTLHGAEPVLNEGPLVRQDTRVPPDVARSFIEELM